MRHSRLLALGGVFCTLFLWLRTLAVGYDAPFGLRWGMTIEEFRALQLPLVEQTERADMGLALLKTKRVPQTLPDTSYVIVVFDNETGARLVKVIWRSNIIKEDPSGRKGRELYDDVKKALIDRVGLPPMSIAEGVFERVYRKSDEFYECLKSGWECGRWVTEWQAEPGGGASLTIKGLGHGTGLVKVYYADLGFDHVMEHFKQREAERRQREQESRQKGF